MSGLIAALKNWRTTSLGIVLLVDSINSEVLMPVLDNDSATTPNWTLLRLFAYASVALVLSADASKFKDLAKLLTDKSKTK